MIEEWNGMKPATIHLNLALQTLSVAAMSLLVSCGGSKTQVAAAPPTTSSALTGSTCTKEKCPPADLHVSANFAASGILIGFSGEPVNWNFYGIDKNTKSADGMSSTRKVVVLLNDVPKGSDISPAKSAELSSETRIEWTPTKVARGKMEFIARDYDRCLLKETRATCNKYVFLTDYDRRFSDNSWEILDKEAVEDMAGELEDQDGVVNVSDKDCGTPTSDAALNMSMLKLGLSVLQGGGLNAILPSLAGSLLGGGDSTPAKPTEC
jgi:hypothetical protein